MTEQVEFRVDVVETGAGQASVNIDEMGKSAGKAEKAVKGMGAASGKAGNGVKGLGKEASEASKMIERAKNAFIGYMTIAGGLKLANIADDYRAMSERVKMATNSVDEYNYAQQRLMAGANRSFRSIKEAQELFIATSDNLRQVGFSLKEAIDITDSLSYAFVRNATASYKAQSAIMTYDRILGKGKANAIEWQSMMGATQTLAQNIGDAYGKTAYEINALGMQGKITSEMLNRGLLLSLEDNANAADSMANTVGDAFVKMGNEFSRMWGEFNKSTGITSAIAAGIIYVADNLDSLVIPAVTAFGFAAVLAFGMAKKAVISFTLALAANPIGLIAVAISAAATALYHFRHELILVKDEGITFGDVMGGAFDAVVDKVKDAKTKLMEFADDIYNKYTGTVDGMSDEMKEGMSNLFSNMTNPLKIFSNSVLLAFRLLRSAFNNFVEFVKAIGGSIAYALLLPFEKAINGMHEMLEGASGWFGADVNLGRFSFASQFQPDVDKLSGMLVDGVDEAFLQAKDVWYDNDYVGQFFDELGQEIFNNEYSRKRRDDRLKGNELDDDAFNTRGKGGLLGGVGGEDGAKVLDAYTKKLISLADETSNLVSLNRQLEDTGYISQYNAVSSLNYELNSQTSILSRLSEQQKEMLIAAAEQLDSQKQINSILSLRAEYDRSLDDMNFELSLYGKATKDVENLRFEYELYNKVKAISIGMSEENIKKLEEEIEKIRALKAEHDKAKEVDENSAGGGIVDAFKKYGESLGTLREQYEHATTSVLDNMTNAFTEFVVNGKFSFKDLTNSILSDLARILTQMALVNAVKGVMGLFSDGGVVGGIPNGIPYRGYSDGGFTGIGGKYQPAGIVHMGEVVFSQADVARHGGVSRVENMRLRGFANGGAVGSVPASKKEGGLTVNIHNSSNSQVSVEEGTDRNGMPSLEVFVKQVVSQVDENILTNGSTGKAISQRFNLQNSPV